MNIYTETAKNGKGIVVIECESTNEVYEVYQLVNRNYGYKTNIFNLKIELSGETISGENIAVDWMKYCNSIQEWDTLEYFRANRKKRTIEYFPTY